MPILLNDLSKTAKTAVKTYTPKFFHSKLTGRGGSSVGLLSNRNNPASVIPTLTTKASDHDTVRKSYKSGQTSVNHVPVAPLVNAAWNYMHDLDRPDVGDLVKLATDPVSGVELYLIMEAHAMTLEETTVPDPNGGPSSTKKTFRANYAVTFFQAGDMSSSVHARMAYPSYAAPKKSSTAKANVYWMEHTSNPMQDLQFDVAQKLRAGGWDVDFNALNDYLTNFDLHDAVCARHVQWSERMDTIMETFLANVDRHYKNDAAAMAVVQDEVKYIMTYNVPLDLYRNIYASVKKYFNPADAKVICKQNLNLLLSDTLSNLQANKPKINGFTPAPNTAPLPASVQNLSPQQSAAVMSTEPLVLVQSGAGTGKAVPLDEPVLTPSGWTEMGKLNVGDEVVGSDGKPHKVLRIHEQGLKPGYEITFRDGAHVRCCGEHLWTVVTKDMEHGAERRSVIDTETWLNGYHRTHSYLPVVEPVEYEFGEKDLPLDPYFLGALLADDALALNSVQYTKSEASVANAVKTAAARDGYEMRDVTTASSTATQWRFDHPSDRPRHSRLKSTIKALGLEVKSRDKFIPDAYKTASVSQRKALLNGLFDGDGDIRTGRTYARFNTSSDRLAEDVLQLLWSLGLSAVKQRQKHSKGDYWSVNLLDGSWDPFIASEYAGKATGSVRPLRRSIKSARKIDPVPMRCIEVDAPDKLYVTRDFLVTHNSTLILGRIDYLIHSGVDAADITVLSFTNAAADHIKDKNPNVHSMTIASMIHEIYTANFQNHELSTVETIMNALDIYYPKQLGVSRGVVDEFQRKLKAIAKNEPNNYTEMNNFVEDNYDDVIGILDTIGQTSLELEIIVCYQKIDTFVEPPTVQSKFLIIDEVQDNSIFEFVYTLRYISKHMESLFIVGDCSQTLYEFRASNPRALNILESSGTFATFQLTVNYRSNQEILDFANVLLGNIEANQYAQIQLQANSLAQVTEQSFLDHVWFNYHQLNKISDFRQELPGIFSMEVRDYIDKCLARGEQIAVLAYTRFDVNIIKQILEDLYPNNSVVSLVPQKAHRETILSEFIKKFWNEVKFAPYKNIPGIIQQAVVSRLQFLVFDEKKSLPGVQLMLDDWRTKNEPVIRGWINQATNGQMSEATMLDLIKDNLLKYEIKRNGMKQSLTSQRNQMAKANGAVSNADFAVSTIHSAKGLEFDNVIVIYKNESQMPEDSKRMYYVALTRAMKSEYVLAYDTVVRPQIQADYITVLERLHAVAPAPNSPIAMLAAKRKRTNRIKP